MTREEAIKRLKEIDIRDALQEDYDALHMAIEALKQNESAEEWYKLFVEKLEQEQKTGHWIMSDDGLYRPICDKCGAHPWKGYIPTVEEATEVFNYCPNCGAKMENKIESEEKR